jgi:hypothetical protein
VTSGALRRAQRTIGSGWDLRDLFAGDAGGGAIAIGDLFSEVLFDGASDEHDVNFDIGLHFASAFFVTERNDGDGPLKVEALSGGLG